MEIKLEIDIPTKKSAWKRIFIVKGQATKRLSDKTLLTNVTDCCHVPLKQSKFCSKCGGAAGKVSQKALHIPGTDEPALIDVAVLEEIEESVADKRASIRKVMRAKDIGNIGPRIVNAWYLYPEEDSSKEMANIVAALQAKDLVFVGVLTVRGVEYESVFRPVGEGLLVAEMLCEPSKVYATPSFECPAANEQVVEKLAEGLAENVLSEHEFDRRDTATVLLEEAIMDFVTTGVLPKSNKVERQDAQDLEALQEVF